MEEFAIGANFEGAAARRDERERLDTLAEFKNLGRQTDGLGRVVSNHAIFDRYFGFQVETPFRFKARISERSGQWFWPLYFLRQARSRDSGYEMRWSILSDYGSRQALRPFPDPHGRRAWKRPQKLAGAENHQ